MKFLLASALIYSAAAFGSSVPDVLLCTDAEAQSPRDVTPGSFGAKSGRNIPPLNYDVINDLVQVNTHFHYGAEHYSEGQYDQVNAGSGEYMPGTGEQPGWFCDNEKLGVTTQELTPFTFQYCDGVEVGNTYEIHWVYSSGGSTIADGLGGAFARTNNADVIVASRSFVVVNDGGNNVEDLLHTPGFESAPTTYYGSTTGASFDNTVCSPYQVTWAVDPMCNLISASSFDTMCRDMKEQYQMTADTAAHGSRTLVSEDFVARDLFVSMDAYVEVATNGYGQ